MNGPLPYTATFAAHTSAVAASIAASRPVILR
jgi:hypothetical protein